MSPKKKVTENKCCSYHKIKYYISTAKKRQKVANSAYSDQTNLKEPSGLGLYCLPRPDYPNTICLWEDVYLFIFF